MKKYYMLEICSEKEVSIQNIHASIKSKNIDKNIQYIGIWEVEKQ